MVWKSISSEFQCAWVAISRGLNVTVSSEIVYLLKTSLSTQPCYKTMPPILSDKLLSWSYLCHKHTGPPSSLEILGNLSHQTNTIQSRQHFRENQRGNMLINSTFMT